MCPLRGCDLPRMLAEMTPMRNVFFAGSAWAGALATKADAAAEPVSAARSRRDRLVGSGMMQLAGGIQSGESRRACPGGLLGETAGASPAALSFSPPRLKQLVNGRP